MPVSDQLRGCCVAIGALSVGLVTKGLFGAHPPLACNTPGQDPIWSNPTDAVNVGGIACAELPNSYETGVAIAWNAQDLGGAYSFGCARIATRNSGEPLSGAVALHLDPNGGTPDIVDLIFLSSVDVEIPSGNGQLVTVVFPDGPFCIDLEESETLVLSLHLPNSTTGFATFAGSANSSRDTFFRSTTCGTLSYVSLSSIGWPNRHWFVELSGTRGCDADCDLDGVSDAEEIADGAPDSNGDGVVDECQCIADVTGDGAVDGADLSVIIGFWGEAKNASPADINMDGVVDGADLSLVIGSWGECPVVVSSISPAAGNPGGGTVVTLHGRRLGQVVGVLFGGVEATAVEVVGDDSVIVTTPPASEVSVVDITVLTENAAITINDAFTYRDGPSWAAVLEEAPDPNVVEDPAVRSAIVATGLPWRVEDVVTGIELLLVPPGEFFMGCTASVQTACADDEVPPRLVRVTEPYYLGRYEVTQSQWLSIMGFNPSQFSDGGQYRPVERVTWQMVQAFESGTGLRLPTEAEWEYACRAGTTTAFSNASSDEASALTVAWCSENSGGQTHSVGQKPANPMGFHDMHGNVYEWCEDWIDVMYYMYGPTVDPTGPFVGVSRVLRGGGWFNAADKARSSNRGWAPPVSSFEEYGGAGFRAARTP